MSKSNRRHFTRQRMFRDICWMRICFDQVSLEQNMFDQIVVGLFLFNRICFEKVCLGLIIPGFCILYRFLVLARFGSRHLMLAFRMIMFWLMPCNESLHPTYRGQPAQGRMILLNFVNLSKKMSTLKT